MQEYPYTTTGIRLDPQDEGAQARATACDDLLSVKDYVDYAAISSRYVDNLEKLREMIERLEA